LSRIILYAIDLLNFKEINKIYNLFPCCVLKDMILSALMIISKVPLKILRQNLLIKVLFLALLYSVIPLAEILLLFLLGSYIGDLLVLACAALTGVIGVLIIVLQIQIILFTIKKNIREGIYPGREFISITGVLVGAIFLITPGFITDFVGFLLFLPLFRNKIGKFITKRMEKHLKDIYEYLKLYEI